MYGGGTVSVGRSRVTGDSCGARASGGDVIPSTRRSPARVTRSSSARCDLVIYVSGMREFYRLSWLLTVLVSKFYYAVFSYPVLFFCLFYFPRVERKTKRPG